METKDIQQKIISEIEKIDNKDVLCYIYVIVADIIEELK